MPVTTNVQIFSNYDNAVVDFVHSLQIKERPLLCVFATPSRSFAQMRKVLRERRGEIKTIPLPFASIQRVREEYDPMRFNNSYIWRWAANADLTKWYGVQRPAPYNFHYQVDLWARNLRDLDNLSTQLALRLRADEVYLTVDHPVLPTPDLVGTTQLLALTLFRGVVETSEVEPGSPKNRVLRRSYSYLVHGWRDYPAEEYGIVERIRTDLYDTDDYETEEELLGTVIVTGELTE